MLKLLTRPRGRALSAGGLFGFDPDRREVDMEAILRRQRERDRMCQVLPPVSADRFMRDPRFMVGLACPTGVLASPKRDDDGRLHRSRYAADAFDGFLWELDRGLWTVGLWLQHSAHREVGTTADGGFLRLFRANLGLMFAIDTATARGQIVAGLVRRRPDEFAQVSIGSRYHEFTDTPVLGGGIIRDISAASVEEISLVPSGAMPGTWIH